MTIWRVSYEVTVPESTLRSIAWEQYNTEPEAALALARRAGVVRTYHLCNDGDPDPNKRWDCKTDRRAKFRRETV